MNDRVKVLIKWPTRARWGLFSRQLAKYHKMLSGKHDVQFLVSADIDDPDAAGSKEAIEDLYDNVKVHLGESKTKIEAVNADMDKAPEGWELLILASDDMSPQIYGYDDITANDLRRLYPDTFGALWYHDGRQHSICTLSIMGRKLYDHFGYVYHPSYVSLWSDNEYTEACLRLGCVARLPACVIKHDWIGQHAPDSLHKRNESFYHRDQQNFDRRKALGFPR